MINGKEETDSVLDLYKNDFAVMAEHLRIIDDQLILLNPDNSKVNVSFLLLSG